MEERVAGYGDGRSIAYGISFFCDHGGCGLVGLVWFCELGSRGGFYICDHLNHFLLH